MLLNFTTTILVLVVQQNNACFVRSTLRFVQKAVVRWDGFDAKYIQTLSVNDKNVDIRYWNSKIGNDKSIKIKFNHEYELSKHWIPDLPLKVIIHGWLDSIIHEDGVSCIKTAYVKVGGYNVITVDWGGIASFRNYLLPVLMTSKIGARLSRVLKNIVDLGVIKPADIHLIGHSLGAHIAGVCGSLMKSGKIGRITGLDPAGPGFEFAKLQKKGLKKSDALFVDVIHTAGGSTGIYHSVGHADFFPNGGSVPQPGCYDGMKLERIFGLVGCSHSRAYILYEDSVYHPDSMMGHKCKSWKDYVEYNCDSDVSTPMGHSASPKMRGDFYLITKSSAPFDEPDEMKEDL
ncbi:pancreatic lipase-related protein 2-like isoform X2 [Myzus persicae]|uniref:pancreatic lipase-related protein 2-like isoform X2 n=1 Tax=Myzus persicae TaxID=13164 RepID=UPI000B933070|nr:pancreatic lipase-related protein 2-like isoform X2 [Myzus persicae]